MLKLVLIVICFNLALISGDDAPKISDEISTEVTEHKIEDYYDEIKKRYKSVYVKYCAADASQLRETCFTSLKIVSTFDL